MKIHSINSFIQQRSASQNFKAKLEDCKMAGASTWGGNYEYSDGIKIPNKAGNFDTVNQGQPVVIVKHISLEKGGTKKETFIGWLHKFGPLSKRSSLGLSHIINDKPYITVVKGDNGEFLERGEDAWVRDGKNSLRGKISDIDVFSLEDFCLSSEDLKELKRIQKEALEDLKKSEESQSKKLKEITDDKEKARQRAIDSAISEFEAKHSKTKSELENRLAEIKLQRQPVASMLDVRNAQFLT